MEPGVYVVDEAGALYQVPDYLPAGRLPDTRAGVGDPTPLAMRLRRAYPGDPAGKTTPLTVSNTVVTLTLPDDALSATLQATLGPLRYTFDGSDPSGTNGFRADPSTLLQVTGRASLQAMRLIREGAVDVSLIIQFWT